MQLRIVARDGRERSVDVLEVLGLEASEVAECSLVTCQPLPPGKCQLEALVHALCTNHQILIL